MRFTNNARRAELIDNFSGEYAFLNNFHLIRSGLNITLFGTVYKVPSVEHGFQASKALHQDDAERIIACSSPGAAWRLGKELEEIRPDWDNRRLLIMHILLQRKFSKTQPGAFDLMLAGTGTATLVEGNTHHDQYWGDCHCPKHERIGGKNKLGRMLMDIRKRNEYPPLPGGLYDAPSKTAAASSRRQ